MKHYVSTDCGKSWHRARTRYLETEEDGNHAHRRRIYVDSLKGWYAYGKQVFMTRDGGRTFSLQRKALNLGGKVKVFHPLDSLNGWAVDDQNELAGINTLFRTFDGGRSFQYQREDPVSWHAMDFADGRVGALAGSPLSGPQVIRPDWDSYPSSQRAPYVVLSTRDGGGHWTRFDLDPDEIVLSLSFPTPGAGYLVSLTGPEEVLRLRRSTDEGLTWTAQALPFRLGNAKLEFRTGQEGWIAGRGLDNPNACFVYRTADAGLTWERIFAQPGNGINDMQIVDAHQGWLALDNRNVYETRDGGRTWDLNLISMRHEKTQALRFDATGEGWAAADWKTFHTPDGGRTWLLIEKNRSVDRIRLAPGAVWAGGDGGLMISAPKKPIAATP